MIIDDEEIIREGLIKTVDWPGMGCVVAGEAEDGNFGIQLVKSSDPDIIITDIRMPGLNGLEMISRIRSLKYDCKIIILTGFRDFEYAQEAIRHGAFRFLLKPVKTEELNLAITEAAKEIRKEKSKEEIYTGLEKKVKEYYGLKVPGKEKPDMGDESCNSSKYLVSRALEYMKCNFDKDLSLKAVADEIYVSTWHLSKVLKKETGDNFINILNGIRIEKAKKLLLDPRYKIYEIAGEVGFADVPYFTKIFKKVAGCTPMEYKNKAGG